MSEPENFLSRWSRRKRDAAQDEAQDAAQDTAQDAARAGEEIEEPVGEKAHSVARPPEDERPREDTKAPAAAAKPEEPPFDLKDLPPIESITAATDLRPFLAPGVPAELTRAALRRAWVADPAIRNFVGLAEYAWDYHEAGSMAGFGPLEMTEELRQVVARIIGPSPEVGGPESNEGADAPIAVASADDPKPSHERHVAGSALPVASPERIDSRPGPPQDSPVNRQDVAGSPEPLGPPTREHTAVHQQAAHRENMPSIVRRGHGGALPK